MGPALSKPAAAGVSKGNLVRQHVIGDGAGGLFANGSDFVGAAAWAVRLFADGLVGAEDVVVARNIAVALFVFESPDGFGAFDGLEISDTSGFRRGLPGFEQIRNRYGGQHPDDGHHNHNFN